MKKLKRLHTLGLVTVVTISALSLAGCGKEESQASEKQAEATLNLIQSSDPSTIDVNDARNSNEFLVLNATQEGLFRVRSEAGQDSLELAGAKSYDVSEDGTVYTFKLKDAKWSDGKAVIAQHYVDSIVRELNPDNAFAYATLGYDIVGAEEYNTGKGKAEDVGVKAIDDQTLEITLKHEVSYFTKKLANVVFFPIRLDAIEKEGDAEKWKTDWQAQLSNGPFKISEWKTDSKLVLEKNEDYYDADKVKLDGVELKTVSEDATVNSLFQSGQVDAVISAGARVDDFDAIAEKSSHIKTSEQAGPLVQFIAFNQHNGGTQGLLDNAKIRQAISLSLNREDLNKIIDNEHAEPAYSFVPGSVSVDDQNYRDAVGDTFKAEAEKYNTPEKLQKLFQEGLAELGKSTDLTKVNLSYLTVGSPEGNDTATYLQQVLPETLGIQVTIDGQPDSAAFIEKRNNNEYDLLANGWNGDYNDPSTYLDLWLSNGGFQKFYGGYASEEFDALHHKLDNTSDTKERLQLYSDLEKKLLVDDWAVAPFLFNSDHIYVADNVEGLEFPVFGASINFNFASKK
ncbi:MAG: peptide ABC transporter substrate-binding protein [Enterococcus sp.]